MARRRIWYHHDPCRTCIRSNDRSENFVKKADTKPSETVSVPTQTFRTKILESGKTAAGIQVPPEVVAALGSSKKPAVRVTLNGYAYRSTVAVMDGKFMLPVS